MTYILYIEIGWNNSQGKQQTRENQMVVVKHGENSFT